MVFDLDNDNQINVECTNVTSDQRSEMLTGHGNAFSLFNVNRRNLCKNFCITGLWIILIKK